MVNATTPASSSTAQAALKLLRDRQNKTFSEDLWYIILSVLAAMTLGHITVYGLRLLRKHRALHGALDAPETARNEERFPSPHGPIAVRRLPLAAVNAFRIVFFRWKVPFTKANLADACFTLGYTALMLTMSFISSHDANITLWSSRTGAIAISQLALLPVLASKNNIISILTGISHEKMAFLHRAAGRNMLLLLWIHAVGKWYTGTRFTALKAVLGGTALLALSVTFLLSLKPIRSFVYELFLVTHIVLIAIFMVCGWYHVEHTHRTGYWVWAGMILWAFDRLLRFARTIYNARLWSSKSSTEATIELISEDTIRVTMDRPMSWTPGQHAFLTFPGISANPLEAHPFTIATIPDPPRRREGSSMRELSFIIRGRSGFTGKLRRQAQIGRSTVTAYVDGPYGAPPDLSSFSTAILIAGGSGVSYTISMFENLIQQACNGTSTVQRIVFVWSIRDESHISWIYDQLSSALACVPETLSVSVQIFVTRAPSPSSMKGMNDLNRSDSDLEGYTYENLEKADVRSTPGGIWSNVTSGSGNGIPYQALSRSDSDLQLEDSAGTYNNLEKAALLHSTPGLRVMSGRPDVYSIIAAEVATSYGAVSVDVSGPAPMIASVRAATRASEIAGPAGIARGMPSVSLHAAEFRM